MRMMGHLHQAFTPFMNHLSHPAPRSNRLSASLQEERESSFLSSSYQDPLENYTLGHEFFSSIGDEVGADKLRHHNGFLSPSLSRVESLPPPREGEVEKLLLIPYCNETCRFQMPERELPTGQPLPEAGWQLPGH